MACRASEPLGNGRGRELHDRATKEIRLVEPHAVLEVAPFRKSPVERREDGLCGGQHHRPNFGGIRAVQRPTGSCHSPEDRRRLRQA